MQNKINLVIFASSLHDNTSVIGSRSALFEGIRQFAELDITYPSMLSAGRQSLNRLIDGGQPRGCELPCEHNDKTVCFIATGGTEEIFRDFVDALPHPVLLLSDGLHNSFAAAFEIMSYLEQHGIDGTLFNAPLDYSPDFFQQLEHGLFGGGEALSSVLQSDPLPKFPRSVVKAFEKTKVGLIGGASGWLISSGIDRKAVTEAYGARFQDIELNELEEAYHAVPEDAPEVGKICGRMAGFLTGDRTEADLTDAARMYAALRKICAKYELNALTLKCFGILGTCRTTACLALSLLNDEGIVSGCEGDIPALWTMLYVKYAYGQPAFMANPASSNRKECTIDFAHCTIPVSMVHGYRLPSHFESQTGIGIAGSVPSGRYRIVKISGEKLDRYYETEGDLIMNTYIPQRCRTQIRFRFSSEAEFDRFLRVSKGNHIILCRAAGPGGPSR
ncbi:MAG: hypothetical protein IKX34_08540 [Bacteroidales bacterium]|nr:hypothetical protein [Bacteroidales bacterium]